MKLRTFCVLLFLLHVVVFGCSAETLGKLLDDAGIPVGSMSKQALSAQVQGAEASDLQHSILAYRELDARNEFTGPLRVIEFDKRDRRVLQSRLKIASDDACIFSGSAESVSFLHQFTLVSTSLSPSADCLFVLDSSLQIRRVLYGFEPTEVLPGQLLIIEDLIHFAPVHPERLQLANLRTGATLELYPPARDALRARLSREHAKRMPPQKICQQMNDPCSPELFDETIGPLATDGQGGFAFLVTQSADHATLPEAPPETLVTQTVLYVYQQQNGRWFYCEEEVSHAQEESLSKSLAGNFAEASAHCKPGIRVSPDLSIAANNPFSITNPGKRRDPR